jgi:hypothetical protein
MAAPDNRVLVTFDNGQTFVVDADQVRPESGGFVI